MWFFYIFEKVPVSLPTDVFTINLDVLSNCLLTIQLSKLIYYSMEYVQIFNSNKS